MIPYFTQERPESCVPACLRMVLASMGADTTEEALYLSCETDIDGTLPSKAVQCAQSLGFNASSPRLSGLDELYEQIALSHSYPIVFVNLSPILGINVIHAVIVETIDREVGNISPKISGAGHNTKLTATPNALPPQLRTKLKASAAFC